MPRPVMLGALVAGAALAGVAPPGGGTEAPFPRLSSLRAYAVASRPSPDAPAERSPHFWGGRYIASTGESVRVIASDRYPVDESVTRRWAEFLAGLIHGSELARVSLYLAPVDEVELTCRTAAAACYSPEFEIIVAPLEGVPNGPSAEALVAHEYGHHVASHRLNPPWEALTYGTKRWASRMDVCARTARGTLFPGDAGALYLFDPGEGFAESYRVLNEKRTGRTESPWQLVDGSLYPSDAALVALEHDVRTPWTRPAISTRSGSFRRRGPALRSFPVATPDDGTLDVTLVAPAKTRFRLSLYDARRKTTIASARPGVRQLSRTVCGHRTLAVRVSRVSGFGLFELTISKP